jgi:P27 family predicted phage terminase small subunit
MGTPQLDAAPANAQPPAWLCEDGRGYWHDLARHLNPGVIKPADAHAMGMLCNALATYAEADKAVQDEGILWRGEGGAVAHPALAIRAAAEASVAKWSAYLGITPADREAHRRTGEQARVRHRREQ